MSNSNPMHHSVHIPSLAKALTEESARQLAAIKPTNTSLPLDSVTTGHTPFSEAEAAKKNFDQKIYMFPESYNQLRKELINYWPHTWSSVGWSMAYKAEDFVAAMNEALGLKLQFDTQKVEAICLTYLHALRDRRGGASGIQGSKDYK